MRRLIIGCGYLGRRVADRWLAAGDTVAALTRTPAHAAELRERGIRPLLGDVMQPASLAALPAADTVLYAVGYDRNSSHTRRDVYVRGLENVLQSLSRPPQRFVYVSSTSVYGQSRGEWVDEDSPCQPTRPNGRTCLEAERRVARTLAASSPGALRVLRLSGLYGPDRLIGRVTSLGNREPLRVNPDGWLNLIHVDDAAAAVVACADNPPPPPPADNPPLPPPFAAPPRTTYLVTDDRPLQRRTFYTRLAELTDSPPPVFAAGDDLPPDLGKRCRNKRLREELRLCLQFPDIDTGLPDALARTRAGEK